MCYLEQEIIFNEERINKGGSKVIRVDEILQRDGIRGIGTLSSWCACEA
jgi:hypothetical protein